MAALLHLPQTAMGDGPDNRATDPVPVSLEKNGENEPVTLLSDHVLRAQLTPRLEDKAPTERLGPLIRMNEEGLLRIYLFTELKGLENHRVYFDWYLDSERQARVTVRPHLEQMRASASKFIDTHMLGQWEVRVILSDDTLLTKARFEVLPHDSEESAQKVAPEQSPDNNPE